MVYVDSISRGTAARSGRALIPRRPPIRRHVPQDPEPSTVRRKPPQKLIIVLFDMMKEESRVAVVFFFRLFFLVSIHSVWEW